MVRTRAENTGRRAVAAKAPRKQVGSSSSGGGSVSGSPGGKDKNCGGNPVRWTPTPTWQKGIGSFFGKNEAMKADSSLEEQPTISDEAQPSDNSASTNAPKNSEHCSTTHDEITSLDD